MLQKVPESSKRFLNVPEVSRIFKNVQESLIMA